MSGHQGARTPHSRRGSHFGHALPPDALAKLQRLLRTRGVWPTAELLRSAPATLDSALIGNLQLTTLARLVARLAEVA